MTNNLLPEIDRFLARTGWSDYKFGIKAIKNGRLVERLRAGRRIWPETEMQVRAFIRSCDDQFSAREHEAAE